ncbi:MAG: hypothetical protein R3F34_01765 [Planctomycetota bacterium]
MSGHVVLGRLALLKLRGVVRKHLRRLARRPAGVLFAFVGTAVAGSWIASLGVGRLFARTSGVDVMEPGFVRLMVLSLVALNVSPTSGSAGSSSSPRSSTGCCRLP